MARAIELVQERQRAIKNRAVRQGRPRALDLVKPPTIRERARPLRDGRNPSQLNDRPTDRHVRTLVLYGAVFMNDFQFLIDPPHSTEQL
jgi:hypothetical protein